MKYLVFNRYNSDFTDKKLYKVLNEYTDLKGNKMYSVLNDYNITTYCPYYKNDSGISLVVLDDAEKEVEANRDANISDRLDKLESKIDYILTTVEYIKFNMKEKY